MTLLDHVPLPVASEPDALATARKLEPSDPEHLTALHLIEKGKGRPDKTPVEQFEELEEDCSEAVDSVVPDAADDSAYARGIAGAIFEAAGRDFLAEWAHGYGLADADLRVETGDVDSAIWGLGAAYSLVTIGATEAGLLSRSIRGSLAFDTFERLDTPVRLTERASARSLVAPLIGRG